MINFRQSRNLAARPCGGRFHASRDAASARSRILILLASWLALVTPLRADNPPTYLFQWGSSGSGTASLNLPQGIAVDSSNNVYVADTVNYRVEKFDRSGNYLTQWGSSGTSNGQFDNPSGIAVDSSNNVYVVEKTIIAFRSSTATAIYLTQWGSPGSGNGQFVYPYGIAVDSSNNVYVIDQGNYRIEKFDSNGNYLTQWGSYGSGNGQFYSLRHCGGQQQQRLCGRLMTTTALRNSTATAII